MAFLSPELLYRLANLALAGSALGVAILIVQAIHHRASQRVEPLGVVFALVFLGIGLRAAVRVWASPWPLSEDGATALIVMDWIGAAVTFVGIALIALANGGVGSSLNGTLIAIGMAFTWACYTIAIAPLMRRYSPYRISALVLAIGWVPLALVSIPQLGDQHFSFGWKVWLAFAYAVVGPLFLTNILWFTAIARVGASRASLFANLQPFFAVFFALILLKESLHTLEIAGGVLIFAGIAWERFWRRPPPASAPP